jgi:hypothetical protein
MLTAAAMVAATGFSATQASASPLKFHSASAATCAVGDPAVINNLYFITGGTMKLQPGATGLVTVYCAVPFIEVVSTSLTQHFALTYQDSTGTATSSSVKAQYIAMNQATGNISTITSISSDSFAATTTSAVQHTADFVWNPSNPTDFAYYIRIDITRGNAADSVIAYNTTLSTDTD